MGERAKRQGLTHSGRVAIIMAGWCGNMANVPRNCAWLLLPYVEHQVAVCSIAGDSSELRGTTLLETTKCQQQRENATTDRECYCPLRMSALQTEGAIPRQEEARYKDQHIAQIGTGISAHEVIYAQNGFPVLYGAQPGTTILLCRACKADSVKFI